MLGPKKPEASVCWCLSHRLDSKTDRQLVSPARGEYVRPRCGTDDGPEVLAYVGTGQLFERAGFAKMAETDAVSGGFPRVLMRRDLRQG